MHAISLHSFCLHQRSLTVRYLGIGTGDVVALVAGFPTTGMQAGEFRSSRASKSASLQELFAT